MQIYAVVFVSSVANCLQSLSLSCSQTTVSLKLRQSLSASRQEADAC